MKIETGKWVELQYELYAYTDGEPEELMMSTPEGEPEKFVYGKNPRVPELVVAPNIGTYVVFRENPRAYSGGAHGYDNFTPEMEAIFYAAGPSFKQGVELPAMANVNLYLIIARLLGIEPAPNDGDSATIAPLFRP